MATYIGEMQKLVIGDKEYSLPSSGGSGTVTSVRVQATSPVQSSTSTEQTTSLNTTISLANGYGDTKNPYGTKTANYVLAGPTSGSAAAPTFRALDGADIPDLSGQYLSTSYTTSSYEGSVEWRTSPDGPYLFSSVSNSNLSNANSFISLGATWITLGIGEYSIQVPTVKGGTIALTSDIPSSAANGTTGISVSDHSTTTIYGVSSSTTSVTGVSGSTSIYGVKSGTNSTTTASKASGGNGTASSWTFEEKTIPNVTAAGSGSYTQGSFSGGSGSFSATVTSHVLSFSHTHTAATHGTDSHTHTAPTIGTAIKVQSKSGGSNGSASTWSFTDVTVPIRADSATTVPTAASSATTVPIKNSSSTTVITSKTHTITDNGHTHTLS